MHVPERGALLDTLEAIRQGVPVSRLGEATAQNRECHLCSPASLTRFYPADLLAETLEIAARCRFSHDELRYESIPTSWCRRAAPPPSTCAI